MRASLIGLLLLACAPIDLSAGVGPVGKSPGEPNGLEEVRIVRENLEIDLRSLTDGRGIGSVDVVYKLDNEDKVIAGIAEQGIRLAIERFEREHGGKYPPREDELVGGRPIK